jgi:hypothetical protein
VPEFIDPVFVKTSPKRSFSVIQNERFGLVFVKTGSIISGIGASAVIVTYCHVGALRFKRDSMWRCGSNGDEPYWDNPDSWSGKGVLG